MEKRLENIESQLAENTKYTKAMYKRMVGDEKFKQPGLIDEVEKNTTHRKRAGWFITIFTGIGAGFMWVFEWIKAHV